MKTTDRLSQLLILTLVFLASSATAQDDSPAAEPEVVELHFSWPAGLSAHATTSKSRSRTTDQTSTQSSNSSFSFTVEPVGENLRVNFADPTFELSGDTESISVEAQAELTAQIADLIPDYLVTSAGEYVGIEDLPRFQQALQKFLQEILSAEDGVSDQLTGTLTSEAFLNFKTAEQWNIIVGTWAGGELEFGAEYSFSSREPVSIMPGQTVLMNYTFAVLRRLDCSRGGTQRDCVELEMRSEADAADTEKMIQLLIDQLAKGESPELPAFEDFSVENTILLVTEPAGLIPHRYSVSKAVKVSMTEAGERQTFEQLDETEVKFDYTPSAEPKAASQ